MGTLSYYNTQDGNSDLSIYCLEMLKDYDKFKMKSLSESP